MKVSAVLVGVNVAATLSVASQHPAMAQDHTGGTAAFLKNTLVEAAAPQPVQLSAVPQKLPTGSAKVSMSSPKSVATRQALNSSNGVKLRPFVANRKLPSKRDLETTLSMQTAEMDYSNQPTTLDGGVSEYSNYYVSETQDVPMTPRAKYAVKQQQKRANSARLQNAAKVASGFVRQVAPRAVPGASPAVPGQVGFPCADQHYAGMAAQLPHPPQPLMPQMNRKPMANFGQQQFSQAPEAPLQAPRLSPQEQLEMNKLVDNACLENGVNPNAVGQAANPGLYSRIGPPPFPLSLIPEDTMKDFLKGARSRKSAVAGSSLAMGSGGGSLGTGGSSGALPQGGFRSYLHGGGGATPATTTTSQGFGNFSRLPTAVPLSKHPVQPHTSKAHPVKKSSPAHVSMQHDAAPKAPAQTNQVLVYPPYRSHVNFGS